MKLASWSAPGPSGDRQEHVDDMYRGCTPGQRRRLNRVLDELTVRWAINALPPTCRWMMNTHALFLRKEREPTSKEFDDDEWIQWLLEGGDEWSQPVTDADVEAVGPEAEGGSQSMDVDSAAPAAVAATGAATEEPPKVRPIQMGEWLRRWVSRRNLALNKADIEKVTVAMRQLGVGTVGGAEALALFQQVVYELWKEGRLERPLARVKIDETNCFGRLEWPAIRRAVHEALPRHFPVTCWKHAAVSHVEQRDVGPMPKDRGAEQGDVDGPLECSLTLGEVSSSARAEVHGQQRRGELPWSSSAPEATSAAEREFDARAVRHAEWTATVPAERRGSHGSKAIIPDPAHEVQAFGGIADFWYLDDGDILCDPVLVLPLLRAHDGADDRVGGQRNRSKTEVSYFADSVTLAAREAEWQLQAVRELATVRTADESGLTLGVATGSQAAVEEQLARKTQVVRAMQERVAITHDAQTEHVLNRESLGVGRVNHILRVHGDQLARAGSGLDGFDAATRAEMDRLFPGLTDEGHEQATFAPMYGGLGWRRASHSARPANLSALTVAGPKVRHMAAAAVHAGLLRPGQVEESFAARARRAEDEYMQGLDERERVKAAEFLAKARQAAVEQWERAVSGAGSASVQAPAVDAAYIAAAGPDPVAQANDTSVAEGQDGEAGRRPLTMPHLQKELSKLYDCTRLRALEATLTRQCNWSLLARLKELRHAEVSHKWLWHLDHFRGSVLAPCDYVTNVQRRLGARIYDGDAVCRLCGAPLDPQLEHSECCATAEATRGHYACVRVLVDGLKLADPAVTTEPQGLTSTTSRPADILTAAAVPGRSAALDVCVASPNAAAAAGDAAEAAFKRKLRRYRREIPQLRAAGIVYRPLVWTADGRPHPAVTRTLAFAAELAATRSSQEVSAQALRARWRHEIQIALLRRRAAMTRAVLPRMAARDVWLLTGHSCSVPSSTRRLEPLDAAGPAELPGGDEFEYIEESESDNGADEIETEMGMEDADEDIQASGPAPH